MIGKIMKRVIKHNPRADEYDAYLDTHITGVKRAWSEILRPAILDAIDEFDCTESDLRHIDDVVSAHDASKYSFAEYAAYCNYFYPSEGFEKDEAEFDKAWLLHQHRNGHHYQFWCLLRDSGELVPLDMPFEYICEMLCDWHSFTLRDPKSTAYDWWTKNRNKMELSDATVAVVEKLIEFMKEPLEKR